MNISLDRRSDVLYLSLGSPRPDEGEDRPRGVVLRFGISDDEPSGVTIIGFHEQGWAENRRDLAKLVADHLSIDPAYVLEKLEVVD